jgi:hypothetical protein
VPHIPISERETWRQAAELKATHARAVEHIRGRQDLNADGRRRQLAKAHKICRDGLAELRAADQQYLAERQTELVESLFRPTRSGRTTESVMADRDAMARCNTITTPEQAQRMLAAAHDLDDRALARAAARRAADLHDEADAFDRERWAAVIDQWAGSDAAPPLARDHIATLDAIEAEQTDAMTRFAAQAHFNHTPVRELAGQAHQIDRLAAESDADNQPAEPTAAEQAWRRLVATVHTEPE